MQRPLLIILVLPALLAAGCGGDSSSTTSITPFHIPVKRAPIRYEKKMPPPGPSGLLGPEPKPVIPDQPAPEFLALTDLIEGIGHIPEVGEKITVQYVGYDYGSERKFASSWDEGKPLTITLGRGEVIQGWEEGLPGLEVGDRRELVIPPDLSKGSEPPGIPAGKAVVFIVELVPQTS